MDRSSKPTEIRLHNTSEMEWLRKLSDGQGEEIRALHREVATFRAENERLRAEVAEVRAREVDEHRECDEREDNSTRIIGELRAENERLKREVDYWMNLDAQALEAENERLRTVLLEARDSIAGEITFQRGG